MDSINNLQRDININGNMMICFLVDESKRITCPEFKVYVPYLMNGVEQSAEPADEDLGDDFILNKNAEISNISTLNSQGFILAKSLHGYRYSHDGWIPEFRIKQLTAVDGTYAEIAADASNGTTDGVPLHPPHPITQPFKMIGNAVKTILYNMLVATTSESMDYQELNRKYIKKGHKMFCFIPLGAQNELYISWIDGAIPYHEETEDNSANDDLPESAVVPGGRED